MFFASINKGWTVLSFPCFLVLGTDYRPKKTNKELLELNLQKAERG